MLLGKGEGLILLTSTLDFIQGFLSGARCEESLRFHFVIIPSNCATHMTTNKIVTVPTQQMFELATSSSQSQVEIDSIRSVSILLTSLVAREEATIKLIIDCLYDIGTVNLIDTKIRWRSLSVIAKLIVRMSKPVLRIFAWRWFRKNCPQLITNWLFIKVKFQ